MPLPAWIASLSSIAARVASSAPVTFVNTNAGPLRTWLAIGGVLIGGVMYYSNSKKSNAALDALVATQQMTTTLTRTIAVQQTDAFVRSASELQEARRQVGPDYMPETYDKRRAVLDLADAYVTLTVSMGPADSEFLAEKYGAYVERLLSTPFVQDQMLGNTARWASLVKLGRLCVKTDAMQRHTPLITPARTEATVFLDAFDEEAKACRKQIDSILAEGDKRADAVRMLVAGDKEDGLYLFCPYTQRRRKAQRTVAK